MSFHFFPINYQPLYSIQRTRLYISQYIQLLNNHVREKFSALYIEPPLVSSINRSWNVAQQTQRFVSFDNCLNSEINEIVIDPTNYMRYVLATLKKQDLSLFTMMPCIQRDVLEDNGEVLINHNLFIEQPLIEDNDDKEQIASILKNALSMINAINSDILFKDIKPVSYDKQKINFITIEALHRQFPTLDLNKALNHLVANIGSTYVTGVYKILAGGIRLLNGFPTIDNYQKCGIFYVYNQYTNTAVPLIKISIRPSQELIREQIILDGINVLQKQMYQQTILNDNLKLVPSVGIEIFFSNLMLVNLHKYHLCEVVHTACSPELLKYFIDNKVEIF
ncbi:MAG: hypothetical protein LBP70_00920 [Mycoplasmataceae bacterium]|jgi:asparagine synthetase A|nr:hypothetical protein [Mycoplasmataceae bacterium]